MSSTEWTIQRREVWDVYSNSMRVATCDHQGAAEAVVAAFKAQEDANQIVADHNAAEEVARLREIASGMAACVEAMDDNQAWFSRSRIALTLRDSLRSWAGDFKALAPRAGAEEVNGGR